MATPHISNLNSDAQEGEECFLALRPELNGYMNNTAGKKGFFRFNFGLRQTDLTNIFGNIHGKGYIQI